MPYNVGIDIGSTTVKVIVMDEQNQILFKSYDRHFSKVREKTCEVLYSIRGILGGKEIRLAITGSAGLGVAKVCNLPFVQEVFATAGAVGAYYPDTDVVVELGGEDAKIIFFKGGLEERMNGSCAGGTGAFIDQMATLLNVTADELDTLSLKHEKIYSIASRCGVFAKSDIQPLLNQGATKEDLAASIYQAVVDQTVAGLAQGRKIAGKVVFLGGPLFFLKGLGQRFKETLHLDDEHAVFPENGAYFVGIGAAIYAKEQNSLSYEKVMDLLQNANEVKNITSFLEPLFSSEEEYQAFCERHSQAKTVKEDVTVYNGNAYLGIDAGSTTTKLVLIGEDNQILYQFYTSNQGNPLEIVKQQLQKIYTLLHSGITLKGCAVTGYGEDLIKNAFRADAGLVETMAHFKAARYFRPNVDFILDIGGQDIKCFKIKNQAIDSIMLNEACSSGCGSFIETFAKAMGYNIEEFVKQSLFAKYPVDLGSRCTVFMNSSVKQAQKEGAGVDDISAGLSASVIKNAVYKVIRAESADALGENIVVQGGTFYNDAVLRAFEKEIGKEVTRPDIAGLMGAFGAALYAKDLKLNTTSLLDPQALASFTHQAKATTCKGCTNNCHLTINTFSSGDKFISGNRCERPLGKKVNEDVPNLYKYKYNKLLNLPKGSGVRGKIGIPLGLNIYETLPFWNAFFNVLGFEVVLSDESSRKLYMTGQYSIPSDTVCYPAKILHGHIESLLKKGVTNIFYPCMSYNFDEKTGDNHYNCPVVAYYPELLAANVKKLKKINYMCPNVGLHRKKDFNKKIYEFLSQHFDGITPKEVAKAAKAAYTEYEAHLQDIREQGGKAIAYARKHGMNIIILAGRPYHIDPEINHGIDQLITSFNLAVVSEDAVAHLVQPQKVHVLNQWTYHSRLYNSAKFVTQNKDMQLIQLVSFGCGVDAITGDETREILERKDKIYTQLKIDEINNLGAVKIRIRSLLTAMQERER